MKWYALGRDGQATLCIDEADARETARDADVTHPFNAPHRAVQMGPSNDGWLPFSTAPKDGTPFYALFDGLPYQCSYDKSGRLIRSTHCNEEGWERVITRKTFDGVEWTRVIEEGRPAGYVKRKVIWSRGFEFLPTHWMPLPKPPEGA